MSNKTNPMREIKIEKITLNVGAGKDQARLEKGMALLKYLTSSNPIKTITNKRIQDWDLRPGLPIGCKVTIRKKRAEELLAVLLKGKDNVLKKSYFDEGGNLSFGIHEYIDIPSIKYNPQIGIAGFDVCVTLKRHGFRIKRRNLQRRKIPKKHKIAVEDAVEFMKSKYDVRVE